MKKELCVKSICLALVIMFIFVGVVMADYLTADPQPAEMVTKYRIKLNEEIIPANIERVGNDQVRLIYNIDHLDVGKYNAFAMAGNDNGEWSDWSKELVFYRGVPTPQNIDLYCVTEDPKRISRVNWKVYYTSSEEPKLGGELAIDENLHTRWHSNWTTTDPDTKHPHEIQIELGRQYTISGFYVLPRQDKSWNGTISNYKFYVSIDGVEWVEVASGKLLKVKEEQFVEFSPVVAKYISLVALSEVNGGSWTTVADLNILGY